MERVMGLEPTTSTLARSRSTTELHPLKRAREAITSLFFVKMGLGSPATMRGELESAEVSGKDPRHEKALATGKKCFKIVWFHINKDRPVRPAVVAGQ